MHTSLTFITEPISSCRNDFFRTVMIRGAPSQKAPPFCISAIQPGNQLGRMPETIRWILLETGVDH